MPIPSWAGPVWQRTIQNFWVENAVPILRTPACHENYDFHQNVDFVPELQKLLLCPHQACQVINAAEQASTLSTWMQHSNHKGGQASFLSNIAVVMSAKKSQILRALYVSNFFMLIGYESRWCKELFEHSCTVM